MCCVNKLSGFESWVVSSCCIFLGKTLESHKHLLLNHVYNWVLINLIAGDIPRMALSTQLQIYSCAKQHLTVIFTLRMGFRYTKDICDSIFVFSFKLFKHSTCHTDSKRIKKDMIIVLTLVTLILLGITLL